LTEEITITETVSNFVTTFTILFNKLLIKYIEWSI